MSRGDAWAGGARTGSGAGVGASSPPVSGRAGVPGSVPAPTPLPDSRAEHAAPHPLRFGYGTNGLTDLRLDDALTLLADLGYDGVGLTLDHMHLDPLAPDLPARTRHLARRLDALGLGVTVETGARYILDPRRKHGPSLIDPAPEDRARRTALLIRAVEIAEELGAEAVHCFSGVLPESERRQGREQAREQAREPASAPETTRGPADTPEPAPESAQPPEPPRNPAQPPNATPPRPPTTSASPHEPPPPRTPNPAPATPHPPTPPHPTAWTRLADSLTPVLARAATADIPLAVEPEPGHLLATLADFHHLRTLLDDPAHLGLTLDIGHCQCLEPLSPADCVRAAAPWLRHVQIEDMRRGVHEHLPLGDGEIDFPPVLAALAATGYQGLTVVELPRHSHAGPHQATRSLPFLTAAATS
ncbi:sugar phosphate isomerase/epimerase family protein [Streptomyces sp. NPDC004539]|uniref:sugar phosphate isomerase/epimerase family protein n=1 Tax=Streptomyces sp. NPDC004539 TaxID=3154280 RepID=UPI0033A4274C